MKAVQAHQFGGPEVLRLDDLPDPVPGPGEVVIDVHAAGVNPADTYMLTGTYALVPALPYVPGGDCAGVVSAVGPGETGFRPGDRVFVSAALGRNLTGAYAEKILRPASLLIALPDNVDFHQAAAIGVPYTTAHLALFFRGRARSGETVFIHGASGAVGTAAIELARRAGLAVIGSAGSAAGLDLVRQKGAMLAVDHRTDSYLEAVLDATDGQGPALIIEMLANANLAADMATVARSGRIVIVGCRDQVTINPRIAMMKELDILGTAIWNAPRDLILATLGDIVAGLAQGALAPVVGASFPLHDAATAHRATMQPGRLGKITLSIRDNGKAAAHSP